MGASPEGLEEERRALALEPNSIMVLSALTNGYATASLADSARYYAHRMLTTPGVAARLGIAAYALARVGSTDEAKAIMARIEALPPNTSTRWTALALVLRRTR